MLTIEETKLHTRVDHDDEDSMFTLWISVAEQSVYEFLNRNVYDDQAALDAAIAAAPAELVIATAAFEAAMDAAEALSDEVEAAAAARYAQDAYRKAQIASDMVQSGIVINDPMRAAALLLVADLYENREGQTERPLHRNDTFERLLTPYRVMAA